MQKNRYTKLYAMTKSGYDRCYARNRARRDDGNKLEETLSDVQISLTVNGKPMRVSSGNQRGSGGDDGRRAVPVFSSRRGARSALRHGYLHGVQGYRERRSASAQLPVDLRCRHGGCVGMSARFDVVVVGAGPGGMAAAAVAAEAGKRVCLLDANPAPGGQIWRGISAQKAKSYPHGSHSRPGRRAWMRRSARFGRDGRQRISCRRDACAWRPKPSAGTSSLSS